MMDKQDYFERKERPSDVIFDNVKDFPMSGRGEDMHVLVNKALMGDIIF